MVIISKEEKEYLESIGMLDVNMKLYENERIKLGLPDNCTLEELNNAINKSNLEKVENHVEKLSRKSEIEFARKELQIPSNITDEQVNYVLNMRMARLAAINGIINYDDTQKDFNAENKMGQSR